MKGIGMGKSTILARLVAVCAVTAVAGGVLASAPVSAQAPDAPSSSVATPNTSVASPAPVDGDGVTPRGDVVWPCLRIRIAGVSAGGRATVTVTGTKANKRYSKVINRSKTLRVAPGVYRVTAATVPATGGTDVPTVATKTLRVRKNRCTGFTVRYRFVASTPVPPVPPVVKTCASLVVGDTGPGGGKVFYVDMTRAADSQCFEAAPDGWNTPTTDDDPSLLWGAGTGVGECGVVSITTGTAIGDGETNTTSITGTPACDTAAEAPAPWAAKNYTGGSQTDWFLPSRDELNQLCKYARGQLTTVASEAAVCDSNGPLQSGFTAAFYWSSSEYGPGNPSLALGQNFEDGTQGNGSKFIPVFVRPVRAF